MKKIGIAALGLLLISVRTFAAEKLEYATEKDLLTTKIVTPVKTPPDDAPDLATAYLECITCGYKLVVESKPFHFPNQEIRVRVWDSVMKSWPGSQPQIIQVINEKSSVLSAKKVGGSPMMGDGWVGKHEGRLFVYVRCIHRNRGGMSGVYVYEIDKKYSIEEKAIYLPKEELEREERHWEKFREKYRKEWEAAKGNAGSDAVKPPTRTGARDGR
jgi:hypothetical protein